MPRAISLLAEDAACSTEVEAVEDIRIGLPSEMNPRHRHAVCSPRLQEIEARLREAQCHDALEDLRIKLHIINHLYRYKQTNVHHQGPNTRVRGDLASQDERKTRAVEKYRRAQRAKLALSGPGEWETKYRVLEDRDVRGLEDDDPDAVAKRKRKRGDKAGPAEGHRVLSWIWHAADAGKDGLMTDSLRVEWLKARARKMRWEEETKILQEEMRRVLATLEYEETEWTARGAARFTTDDCLREGLAAYAAKQAHIRRAMHTTCIVVCRDVVTVARGGTPPDWATLQNAENTTEVLDDLDAPTLAEMYQLDGEDLAPFANA